MDWQDLFIGDSFDYDALFDRFEWVRAMAITPQDPLYHAEGDVWTHTRMVCAALEKDSAWPSLPLDTRRLLRTAALLHDAGKPETTFTDAEGRIRSPEHALRGETIARRVLWQFNAPFEFREHVAALVRHHMQPRYTPEHKDPRRRVFTMSWEVRCDLLAMLSRADTRGRIANDEARSLRYIDHFTEICQRHNCLKQPRRFSTEHARFLYFRRDLDDADAIASAPAGPTVTIMSGLPGSGKDTWIARHRAAQPVISLDEIRLELSVSPAEKQDRVVAIAHDRALELAAAGTDFVWNATTLSRWHRRQLVDLLAPHDPRVRFVHLDAPVELLLHRNRSRAAQAVVPEDVIWRITYLWQPPVRWEGHDVEYVAAEQTAHV